MMFNTDHKWLSGVVLLTASVGLMACSQPDADAADKQTTATTQVPAEAISPASNTKASDMQPSSTILQNVSATVYKDANCGCCKEWIGHAEDHGMTADGQDVSDLAVFKQRYGVPDNMRSCHTAVTSDGYVFEGHVPAKYVAQFLENPPSGAIGLAVPGMPMGSPGMEYQNRFDPYQIMQINKDGSSTVYAQVESPQQQL
ncbi:DUF411 domain-containing protein [Psychrobacter sp. CAM01]|uniref:DUF411 domain-containing protein n=1 Tax=Psychrobacter sp. CAM01 TaxID=3080335 RepID=UPI002935F57B|nr:DUF411 domain-containing protein [Psychrobacter sp. CAM01]MDV2860229.1 DUF411 domain-containing protein [Psychrobacter sp. CAM01]